MRVLFVISLFILGVFQHTFWFGPNGYFALRQHTQEIQLQLEFNRSLLERNRELRQEIAELRANRERIEEIARHDLGMVGKGEVFYLVVPPRSEH